MKIVLVVLVEVLVVLVVAGILLPEIGSFPQVVSCAQEKPSPPTSDPDWQPPLIVKVEPGRGPGRVSEYRVLGCRLYYYHAH